MKQAAYPSYKPTGVDWLEKVPSHWDMKRLRFAVQTNPVASELRCPPDTLVSFVPMEAVGEYGGLALDQEKPLDEIGSGYTYFRDDDVVVAKITPCFENGKGALAKGLKNGIAFGTTELHVLRARENMDPGFLFYLTISDAFRDMGEAHMYGAGGQKRVPELFIRDLRSPVPPAEEQRKIALFLDRKTGEIDKLIRKREELLAVQREKRMAMVTHAVTQGFATSTDFTQTSIPWLQKIPAHWRLVPLKWCCHIASGQVDPAADEFRELPLIAPDHIESWTGHILPFTSAEEQGAISGKYAYKKGTLLYSKIRPELSKVCIAPVDGLCSADMYAISPSEEISTEYLFYQFLSRHFHQFAVLESMRVAMPKVNREALGAFPIIVPPREEQEAIVSNLTESLSALDRSSAAIRGAIERLVEYRAAVITAAVTGKMKVV